MKLYCCRKNLTRAAIWVFLSMPLKYFFRIWNGGKILLLCFLETDFNSYWMRLRGSYLFLMSLIFAFVDLVDKVAFRMLKNGFEEKQLAAFKILKENFFDYI